MADSLALSQGITHRGRSWATIAATGYSKKLDWEVELAAVIGRPVKNFPSNARSIALPLHLRQRSFRARYGRSDRSERNIAIPLRLDRGKNHFDGACPIGPWIVPADDIPDPQDLSSSSG